MSARAALREATGPLHEELDVHFSAFDLGECADYAAFLTAHARAFLPVEQALTEAGAERLFPQWPEMVRGSWLRADLAALGLPVPEPVEAPLFEDDAAICGGAYVLEGSRLGGTLLRRAVDKDFPHAFLSHDPTLRWPEFVAEIERLLQKDVDRSRAVASANAVFATFIRAAK